MELYRMNLTRPLSLAAVAAVALLGLSACDKDAGKTQKTTGKVESAVGTITGDKELKKEGKKDKVVGGVRSGDLEGAVKDAKKN